MALFVPLQIRHLSHSCLDPRFLATVDSYRVTVPGVYPKQAISDFKALSSPPVFKPSSRYKILGFAERLHPAEQWRIEPPVGVLRPTLVIPDMPKIKRIFCRVV